MASIAEEPSCGSSRNSLPEDRIGCELIDGLHEIVFRTDAEGRWTFLNAAWTEITGFTVEEALGRAVLDFIHPDDRGESAGLIQSLAAGTLDDCHHEVRYRTKDGGYRWVEVHAHAVGGSRGNSGTVVNIQDRHAAVETLRRRETMLEAVSYAAKRFLRGADWDAAIPEVLERLGPAVESDHVCVLERLPGDAGAALVCMRHEWVRDPDAGPIGPGQQPIPAVAPWEDVMDHGKIVAGAVSSFPPAERTLLERLGIRHLAILPVLVDGAVWGSIGFSRRDDLPWAPATLEGLQVAAEIVGVAIQRGRSRESLRLAHAELEKRVAERTRELAEANRALSESERLYRTLVETSPDAIVLADPDGCVRKVNRSCLELFRFEREEQAVGRSVYDIARNDDAEIPRRAREELAATGRLRDLELRLTRVDGSVFEAEVNGTVVRDAAGVPQHIIRMVRDISRRKAAERELRRSERWFRAVFDDAPIGIALIDARGRVKLANPRYQEMLERTAEELIGVPVREFTHPDDWDASHRVAEALRFVSAPMQVVEKRYLAKSGRVVWVRATTSNLLSLADGEHLMIAMVEDVTARKQLEEQFRQAQKMEAVGCLAGGIAHDFNNVLTVIKGYGELLLKHVAADPPAERKASQIVRAADRAAQLVAQLLAFSRKQAVEPKVMDVNDTLCELRGMLSRLLCEDIELTTRLDPDTGSVRADPGQFGQMLMNLAVNARDAMPEGGRLAISTRAAEIAAPPAAGAGPPPGRYAVLEVTDTGCGMSPAVLSRIFEPFFTTKAIGKGTGLGLSTVYGIVQQAGGHVSVESTPGSGTTFHIYLPRSAADGSAAADGMAAAGGAGGARGSETVLLTEDEDQVRDIVAETLRERGYTVLEAHNGREALELAIARREPIDLLLTDVVMPRMGGAELWSRVREIFPRVRVLFLSGHSGAAPAPGPVLLHKPFSPEDLVSSVRAALDTPVAAG